MGILGRRSFLGLLGSAPIAAKVAADKALMAEILPGASLTNMGSALGGGIIPQPCAAPLGSNENPYRRALNIFRKIGFPGWYENELRARCQWVQSLDPDIASKRSWSMAVKIQHQRERNYQRLLANMNSQADHHDAREAFTSKHGWLPW